MPVQPFWSVAVTVIGKLPFCVGVPERTPVTELRVMPVGSVPLFDHVIVPTPPLCVKVWLKAASTAPVVTAGLVTVMVGQGATVKVTVATEFPAGLVKVYLNVSLPLKLVGGV